ncbi:MAG TPA: AMP-binding protein, partial [Thermoguttaceae bacterium]|nr:AMP-binding protein [Thermoguttaceae bacterium]
MAEAKTAGIVNVMKEGRVFPPSPEFSAKARIKSMEEYRKLYQEAADDLEGFWGRLAGELHWFKPFDKVLEWNLPFAKWFVGGQINISYNCLDRYLGTPIANKVAYIWEGEPGDVRVLTYQMLHHEVCKFANVLKKLGIQKGDRVAMYMPMIPELPIAMLACARIGAVHTVIFGGFSAEAIAERCNDSQAKLIITSDAGWRRGKQLPLKGNVDAAMEKAPSLE